MTVNASSPIRLTTTVILGVALVTGCQSSPHTPAADSLPSQLLSRVRSVVPGGAAGATNAPRVRSASQPSKLDTPPAELTTQNYAGVQLALGRSLERSGKLRGAEDAYAAAIRNDPASAEALHRMALLKERLDEGDEAEDLLRRAAELAPDNAEIICDLGYWYALREDWSQAEAYYAQALRIRPDFKRAHNNLGMLLAHRGDGPTAMRHFSAAGLTEAQAHSNLGFAYMSRQQWPAAEQHLGVALQRDPELQQASRLATTLRKVSEATAQTSTPVAATNSDGVPPVSPAAEHVVPDESLQNASSGAVRATAPQDSGDADDARLVERAKPQTGGEPLVSQSREATVDLATALAGDSSFLQPQAEQSVATAHTSRETTVTAASEESGTGAASSTWAAAPSSPDHVEPLARNDRSNPAHRDKTAAEVRFTSSAQADGWLADRAEADEVTPRERLAQRASGDEAGVSARQTSGPEAAAPTRRPGRLSESNTSWVTDEQGESARQTESKARVGVADESTTIRFVR